MVVGDRRLALFQRVGARAGLPVLLRLLLVNFMPSHALNPDGARV